MKNLTASDRVSLIKLASSLPQGDGARKAILAGLAYSRGFTASPKFSDGPKFSEGSWSGPRTRYPLIAGDKTKLVKVFLPFDYIGDRTVATRECFYIYIVAGISKWSNGFFWVVEIRGGLTNFDNVWFSRAVLSGKSPQLPVRVELAGLSDDGWDTAEKNYQFTGKTASLDDAVKESEEKIKQLIAFIKHYCDKRTEFVERNMKAMQPKSDA